ncbi:phosphatase PAP2 family protein [Subtercola vilae]|uniref:Phosphatase PAP2 family protein n=1 Tax=Subtercola vilae TaxID=2056433 RepID=A0A4T2BXW3_9MICO|nr:phosphatase PAP2 family protein [Subtercola vilae]TIH36169.1 phosphatase PAP2 family protein [Subtercola vilae]
MTVQPTPVHQSSQCRSRSLFQTLLVSFPAHLARIIWTAAIGVLVVLIVGLLIRTTHVDFAIVQVLNAHHHGAVGSLANAVYQTFGPAPAIVGTAVFTAIIAAITRSLRVASTFAVTIAGTWVSLAVVKLIVHRPRPDAALLPFPFDPAQIDASYPSGHAAFATALIVTIVLGLASRRNRWIVGTIGGVLIFGVGTALVIDGVHFPSDVIASIVWGITVAPLIRIIWVAVILKAFGNATSKRRKSLSSPES